MTSQAEAASQMERALKPSTSTEKLAIFKDFATLCGIPAIVVNKLTLTDFGDFQRIVREWKNYFNSCNALIERYLKSLSSLRSSGSLTDNQEMFYIDLMVLKNAIILFESCNTAEKMLQWVRGFSSLDLMASAMTEFAIDRAREAGASEREQERIRGLKKTFMGNRTLLHKIRGKMPWSDGSKMTLNLGVLNHQIIKMARWARVEMDKQNDEVDDLLFQARLDNLREDPLKLTGIDRLVQAFADEAARKFLAGLPAAGTKQCRAA
jgi:hypothetical protein